MLNYLTLSFTTKSLNKLEVTLHECSISPTMQHQLPSSVFISKNTFAIGANVFNDVSHILPTAIEEKRFSTIQCWDSDSREIIIQKCLDQISGLFNGEKHVQIADFRSSQNERTRTYHWRGKVSDKERCGKDAKKDIATSKLRLALRFTDINNYLFVYIDAMEGDFYKLPKYIDSGFTFSRSSPDRFYITDFTESDQVHVVFPFNNEYMSRVCIHECAGKLSPRELEEKIVYMLSNKVFKPENQVAIDQDDTKEGWRSYKWVAYI
jgi:hypothetical protein